MKKFTKIKLAAALVIMGATTVFAQNPYKFTKVDYVGAMGTTDWTTGWTNWNPEQTTYPSVTETTVLNAAATGGGKIEITTNVTLDASKVYLLTGIVYVKNGGTLTIPAGTIIRAEGNQSATPANWATIVIQRGGKINATGTKEKPVVFTSNKAAGSRMPGDWGGVILLGKGQNNLPGAQSGCTQCAKGEGIIEGPFGYPDGVYGGNDDADNSGVITYTRIEFPGLVFAANNEINGLTLGSVGYNTELKYIQVSFSNDDSYEWYGGEVNSKYLVAFRGVDDDFDTDFGYRGKNQFGIGFKDSIHFDPTFNAPSGSSTSEGFESDNDGSGSTNTPQTAAIFSNFTMVGPYAAGETYNQHSATVKAAYRRGARIRRNSAQSVVNSVFIGYRNGLMLDGSATITNANVTAGPAATDALMFRNNLFLGMTAPVSATANSIVEVATGGDTAAVNKWFKASNNKVNPVAWSKGTLLVDPNHYTAPNFMPITSSVALSGSDFTLSKVTPNELRIVKHINNGSINVYPNPSNGTANIEMNLINNATLAISLVTLDGKVIRNLNDSYPAGKSSVTFDGLSQGVYIVKVAQDASFNTFKLIVK
jgi:hypothetical protein